jgi:hypothetical protein
MLETAPAMKDANMHNAAIWYEGDASYLVFREMMSAKYLPPHSMESW